MVHRPFFNIILAFLFAVVGIMPVSGQIIVNSDLTPEQMIRDVFTGKGVKVSNITYKGVYRNNPAWSQFGTFDLQGNDPPDFFKKGIILSTGFVVDAKGPNTNSDSPPTQAPKANGSIFGPGDTDLQRILLNNVETSDAAVIEFDFIPYSDTLTFRYVFASEEYQEWVDSSFNDVFAFFIKGNEYPNYTNVALIPGTQQPVAINSVNHKTNSQYYVSNTCPGTCPKGTKGPFDIQYDGFTRVLEATAIVTACSTYRFKIAITDVGENDFFWDSAVFLEANSFSTNANEVTANGGIEGFGKDTITTFESCQNNVRFVFTRKNTDLAVKVPLFLTGTATKDVDYTIDDDTVRFAVGQSSATVNIDVKFDRFVEGAEMIVVNYFPPKACNTLTAYIKIVDLDTTLKVDLLQSDVCSSRPDTLIPIKALINNGKTSIFRFQWKDRAGNTISTEPEFDLKVNRDTMLYVTVFDTVCNAPTQQDSVKIRFHYKNPNQPFRSGVRDTFICQGSNFLLDSKITGGREPITIEWRNRSGNVVSRNPSLNFANFTKDTLLILFAEDDLCKQRIIDTVRLRLNPPISHSKLGTVRVCGDKNFNLNPNVSGSGKFIYEWRDLVDNRVVGTQETLTTSVKADTRFRLFVKDSCFSFTDTVQAIVTPIMRWGTIQVSKPEAVCINDSVDITVNVTSGTGNYTYEWNTGESTNTIKKVLNTDRAIAIVVRDGCTILDTTFFFTVSKPIRVIAEPDTQICVGNSATLRSKIIGGNSIMLIEWRDENNTVLGINPTLTINPTTTQNYILTVIDDCGSLATDTVQIKVAPKPMLTIPALLETCAGIPIKVNSTSGLSGNCVYVWSPITGLDNPFILNPTITLNASATYKVVAICNGCVGDTQTVQVMVNPNPNLSFPQNIRYRCSGDNGFFLNPSVSGGTGLFTYQWQPVTGLSNPNIQNPVANPNQTTSYTLTIKDAKGCLSVPATVWVEVVKSPEGTIPGQYSICENGPGVRLKPVIDFKPTHDDEYLTFEWNPKAGLSDPFIQEPIANPPVNIRYVLTVTAMPSACVNARTISTGVQVKPTPTADAGTDKTICPNSPTLIGMPIGAGDAGISYKWSPATGLSDPNIKQPFASSKHTTKYFLTAEKEGCLSVADTVWVYVKPAPTPAVQRVADICPGDTVQIRAQVGSGFEPYTYEWKPIIGLSAPNILEPFASPNQTTTYTLTVKTPNCTAQSMDSVHIIVLPRLTIDADTSSNDNILVVKKGSSVVIPASVDGDPKEFSAEWLPSDGLNRTDILQPTVTPKQDTRYYLTVKRGKCITKDSVWVRVNAKPVIIVTKDTVSICEGETARAGVLPVSGNVSYDWQPKTNLVSQENNIIFANPKKTQTYTLIVTDIDFADKDTATVTIRVYPKPTPKIVSSNSVACENLSVRFSEESGLTNFWAWDFGDSSKVVNERSPVHYYAKAGNYRVKLKVRSIYGCMDSVILSYRIRLNEQGIADFHTFPEIPATLQIPDASITCIDSSKGAVSWFWEFGDGATSTQKNPTHKYLKDGEYVIKLTITDVRGCVHASTRGAVYVEKGDLTLYNVFTPNGDGYNDTWFPVYMGNLPVEITINDRWGVRVFQGTRNDQWDGKDMNGKILPEGTYFYLVKVGPKFYRGDITLIR